LPITSEKNFARGFSHHEEKGQHVFDNPEDKAPHKRLMRKLRAHGVTGYLLEWVKSWLANCKQRVVLNGKFSSWADVL
jgi:hypothetical protein